MPRTPFRTPFLGGKYENINISGPPLKRRRSNEDDKGTVSEIPPRMVFKVPKRSSVLRQPLVAIQNPSLTHEEVQTCEFSCYYNVLWYVRPFRIIGFFMTAWRRQADRTIGGSQPPKSTRPGTGMEFSMSSTATLGCKMPRDVKWAESCSMLLFFLGQPSRLG